MTLPPPSYLYRGTLLPADVTDGDTVKLLLDLGCRTFVRIIGRLYGIDAPEVRGETKPAGESAKSHLKALIAQHGPEFTIKTHKDKLDKYGRWVIEVVGLDKETGQLLNLNEAMLRAGHAAERFRE